jgi:hypothetical protein
MIAFLIVFIVYQIYRMTFAFSIDLPGLTIFDIAMAWLTYREYGKFLQEDGVGGNTMPARRVEVSGATAPLELRKALGRLPAEMKVPSHE